MGSCRHFRDSLAAFLSPAPRAHPKNGLPFHNRIREGSATILPEAARAPLDALPELAPTLKLLFAEAFSELPGRKAAIDRLFEYVFVFLIRSAMKYTELERELCTNVALFSMLRSYACSAKARGRPRMQPRCSKSIPQPCLGCWKKESLYVNKLHNVCAK